MAYEPCNYVSNVAYYRAVTKVCDYPDWNVDDTTVRDIKRMFSALTLGSAAMHGSHTYVGVQFDLNLIAFIAFQSH